MIKTDAINAANDLVKYQVDLVEEPEVLGGKTNLTAGSGVLFWDPRWSSDDEALVSRVGSNDSTVTDGIYVITLNPFSMKLIASSAPMDVNNPDWKPPVPPVR